MRRVTKISLARLSETDIRAMRDEHIPYRRRLLVDVLDRLPAKCLADNQAFEAGVVSGRILLGFIGIGYDESTKRLKQDHIHKAGKDELTDDVKVQDVGGSFCHLEALPPEEADTLCKFIRGAHKACAHFTMGSDHELDEDTYRKSASIISRLLEESLRADLQIRPASAR
jgi:hypothetical protein